MIKKNLNTTFLTILIVTTIIVFSRNFYNEILQKYLSNPNFFQVFFSDFYLIYAGSEILNQGNNPYKEWLEKYWEKTIMLANEVLMKKGKLCYILSGYGSQNVKEKYDLLHDMNTITKKYFTQ